MDSNGRHSPDMGTDVGRGKITKGKVSNYTKINVKLLLVLINSFQIPKREIIKLN